MHADNVDTPYLKLLEISQSESSSLFHHIKEFLLLGESKNTSLNDRVAITIICHAFNGFDTASAITSQKTDYMP